MDISAPKEWFGLLDILEKERGIAILLGAVDTGKSTLAKFLVTHLCWRGLTIALVDADIGQSFLGPPATIGLALFKSDPDWGVVLSPPEIFFVGSTTPEGHFIMHLRGVKSMADKAFSYGPDLIVVDTTGFVMGEGGRELKRRKIDLLSPRIILALQRHDEMEALLSQYVKDGPYKILRLPLSEGVRPRSMEERRTHRMNLFRDYFKYSTIQEVAVDDVQIEGEVFDPNGALLPRDWSLGINGLLIGLKDGCDNTLALGMIRNYLKERGQIRLFTPFNQMERIKKIQLSSLRLVGVTS